MTYIPTNTSTKKLAQPSALTVIEHTASTTQTISVGNKINIGTVHNWYASFTPTITNNIITLSSGYYYYLESSIQAYKTGSFITNMYLTTQHYDETNTQNIGIPGTTFQWSQQDSSTFSRDACARTLIDCSSSSLDVSLKIIASTGFDRINYNGGAYDVYNGRGRTVIWRLNT